MLTVVTTVMTGDERVGDLRDYERASTAKNSTHVTICGRFWKDATPSSQIACVGEM